MAFWDIVKRIGISKLSTTSTVLLVVKTDSEEEISNFVVLQVHLEKKERLSIGGYELPH